MSIFLLYTPLHAIIAEKIIENTIADEYIIIYISRGSIKDKYYFERVKKNAAKSYYLKKNNSLVLVLKLFMLSLSIKNKNPQIIDFFTGQPKTFYTRFFLLFNKVNLFTFDDGTGNINQDGNAYFKAPNENRWSALFFKILAPKYLYKNFRKRIIKHYTIFKASNCFNNTEYISLFTNLTNNLNTKTATKNHLNIFLSGMFYEGGFMSLSDEIMLYRNVINKFSINKIILHPGSKAEKIFGNFHRFMVNDNPLIAEEIILNDLKEHNLTIYGFRSTTLFLLKEISSEIEIVDLGDSNLYLQNLKSQ